METPTDDEHRIDWGSDTEDTLADDQPTDWGSDTEDTENARISPALSDNHDQDNVFDFNPNNYVLIGERDECEVSRFGLTARCYFMTFRNTADIPDAEAVARAGIDQILRKAFADCGENDLVGVQIDHLALDSQILFHFGDVKTTTADNVLNTIFKVQQSKRELTFDEDMIIKITSIICL